MPRKPKKNDGIINEELLYNNESNECDDSSVKENEKYESNCNNKEETESEESENNCDEQEIIEENDSKDSEDENLQNKLLRLQADFLNYKTRTEKEKISSYSNAICDLINALLPVVDNLERALQTEVSEGDSFKDGVQMVYTQLMGILSKNGLNEIEALHEPFDPTKHYGVAFESVEDYEDDIVIEVLQKGYSVNDKVIRPSMVKINKL